MKKQLSLEQHKEIALELKRMRDRLVRLSVIVGNAYRLPLAKKAGKAYQAIDGLRDLLERELFREWHGISSDEKGKIYYPGGDYSNETFNSEEN